MTNGTLTYVAVLLTIFVGLNLWDRGRLMYFEFQAEQAVGRQIYNDCYNDPLNAGLTPEARQSFCRFKVNKERG